MVYARGGGGLFFIFEILSINTSICESFHVPKFYEKNNFITYICIFEPTGLQQCESSLVCIGYHTSLSTLAIPKQETNYECCKM